MQVEQNIEVINEEYRTVAELELTHDHKWLDKCATHDIAHYKNYLSDNPFAWITPLEGKNTNNLYILWSIR